MTGSNILQEYLIEVGVRADTNTLSKFQGILAAIEKMTVSMTAAMSAGVIAIEGLVYVATNELDDLYWATKRLKSSASDIQDFQLRMQKAGSSAKDARENLETLAAFRRTNPAGDAFLGLMGINAQGKGTVAVMDSLINRFKQLNAQGQYWLAVKWGEQIGLDERQVWNMVQTSQKAENVYADMYKRLGINQKQALQNAHDYQNRLKDLNAELTVVTQTLGLKFLPVANDFLTWLMSSPAAGSMGNALLGIATAIGNIATGAAQLLGQLPPEAQEFGLIGLFLFGKKPAILFAMVGAASALLDKLAGDKKEVQPNKVKEAGESRRFDRVLNRWANDNGLGFLNTNEFNKTYGEYKYKKAEAERTGKPMQLGKQDPYSEGFGAGAGQPGDKNFKPPSEPDQWLFHPSKWKDHFMPKEAPPPTTAPRPLGVRNNNPGNLQPGGKEAVYNTPLAGLQDMGKLLLRYGRQGLTTIESIIKKYAPEFNAQGKRINNTQAYIDSVAKAMGVAASSALNLSNPDTLRQLMSAMVHVEQGYAPYSDKLIGDAANAALGVQAPPAPAPNTPASSTPSATAASQPAKGHPPGTAPTSSPATPAPAPVSVQVSQAAPLGASPVSKSLTVNQTNNTTIHGAKDPAETGKQMKRVSDRTNGDLVRNFSPALI